MTKGQVWRRGGGDLCRRRPPGGARPDTKAAAPAPQRPGRSAPPPPPPRPAARSLGGAGQSRPRAESQAGPWSPAAASHLGQRPSQAAQGLSPGRLLKQKGHLTHLTLPTQGPSAGPASRWRLLKLKSIHQEMSIWSKYFKIMCPTKDLIKHM